MQPWPRIAAVVYMYMAAAASEACTAPASVCSHETQGSFALIEDRRPAAILVDADADPAVRHVADAFAADLQRVSGRAAQILQTADAASGPIVIVGVLGHSTLLDRLARSGKIAASDIAGQWEAYRQIVVEHPFPNVERALVIVGADRRGAVYGTYDLSEQIGVSPWYWWADVPIAQRTHVFITAGSRRDQPQVRYRGFFINDEEPALGGWARQHFGGINAAMYEHVFELLLRLKGNYLWPAMWRPKAFNDDDPRNMILADEMGVVMGTSHHEPMLRAHDEWHRHTDQGVTGGDWDYAKNAANLRKFWQGGIERMMSRVTSKSGGQAYESLVTIGMRGDGDEAMTGSTAIQSLETIVADQRRIITAVTGKPAAQTPQVWALYKEVQDYYDRGMKVPDDVILLFADDNWGQIRRLPAPGAQRPGGYGVYYHFDYVGGPRNYKWLNTVQIEKTWQQMDLAWARGARSLWIVNVGDIKPLEFPLSFFMKQAWDPEAMTLDALARYPQDWARETFGPAQASSIAKLVTRYSQLAARRKPELVDADSFRLGANAAESLDGGEFGAMVAEWQALEREMLRVRSALRPEQRAAYFQLVEHPITALANLYDLYYAVAWNRRLAAARDSRANVFADRAEAAFRRDQEITNAYHALNDGKWAGMMSQTHIGYVGWQQPERQTMPQVQRQATEASPKAVVFAATTGEARGAIAIEAPHYSRAVDGKGLAWRVIPHLGRTLGAVTAIPQGGAPTTQQDGVRLEYDVWLSKAGDLTVYLYLVPTLDVSGEAALRVGLSVDERPMQKLTERLVPATGGESSQAARDWSRAVQDNARVLEANFANIEAGKHVIKVWRLDDNVVLQKVVASVEPVQTSYLGPAEN
jgi:Glycosyl hydrolase family 115/Gylcosyl hydrolase family 115 C-terminal domain